MKNLTTLAIHSVAGGQNESITVTRKISLDGISEQCINTIKNTSNIFTPEIANDGLTSKLFVFFDGCTQAEIGTIASRTKNASFLTVSHS